MERNFEIKHRWVWILNGLVTLGCFIAFLCINGKETVFSFYIPLDVALNVAKTVFFWYNFYEDMNIKADKARLAARMAKPSLNEPLL